MPANPYVAGSAPRPDDDPEVASYKTEEGRKYARQVIATERAVKRRDFVTAFGLANEALTTYADNPRVLAARALAALNLGDYRAAVGDASLVLKKYPGMEPMLTARAAAFNDMGRYAEALQDAEKAVALAPNDGRSYLERALAKEGLRDSPAAIVADYKRAAELYPQYASFYKQALAKLMPENAGRGAVAADSSHPGEDGTGLLADLAQRARNVGLPSSRLFTVACVGLIGLAAAGFLLARRD